jgi:preprotein translocase subunit SecY
LEKFIDVFTGSPETLWEIAGFILLTIVEFAAIVTVDLSERRIPVQYAKQVKGRKMYGGQSSMIPMRISGAGVMPLIFAFAFISLPAMLASLFWPGSAFETGVATWFSGSSSYWYGQLIYMVTLCVLIFAFAFFYSSMQFNPDDVSKTIQQNGGFIQGIRPGKPTADYLRKINNRITLFGAIYLSLVAFIPSLISIIVTALGVTSTDLISVFSTTGILIVVSVALELDKQLQSQLMMKNYKGFLK